MIKLRGYLKGNHTQIRTSWRPLFKRVTSSKMTSRSMRLTELSSTVRIRKRRWRRVSSTDLITKLLVEGKSLMAVLLPSLRRKTLSLLEVKIMR
jgi:3'-phosphoadenosine 5'-phosphosulfate sulfotransferase